MSSGPLWARLSSGEILYGEFSYTSDTAFDHLFRTQEDRAFWAARRSRGFEHVSQCQHSLDRAEISIEEYYWDADVCLHCLTIVSPLGMLDANYNIPRAYEERGPARWLQKEIDEV
jgi:hypothetical protein